MINILADASLPQLKEAFPSPFNLQLYHSSEQLVERLAKQKILLCRSTLAVDEGLLKNNRSLEFIATASSGCDHVDEVYLQQRNIKLIDAKGSNAKAVADYVLATIAFLQTHQYLTGKKVAIVGAGKVGTSVIKRLTKAQFEILTYDPVKALQEPTFFSCDLEALFGCDLICVHANLHQSLPYPSFNLFNLAVLKQLKPGTIIINAARGGIIDEQALLQCFNSLIYCTDVYSNEPKINKKIVENALLCTPHIAGHSLEARYQAVFMLSEKLHSFYGLPAAPPCYPSLANLPQCSAETWQKNILELYNPLEETTVLKETQDLEQSFVSLRKAHQKRHDFSAYRSIHPTVKELIED